MKVLPWSEVRNSVEIGSSDLRNHLDRLRPFVICDIPALVSVAEAGLPIGGRKNIRIQIPEGPTWSEGGNYRQLGILENTANAVHFQPRQDASKRNSSAYANGRPGFASQKPDYHERFGRPFRSDRAAMKKWQLGAGTHYAIFQNIGGLDGLGALKMVPEVGGFMLHRPGLNHGIVDPTQGRGRFRVRVFNSNCPTFRYSHHNNEHCAVHVPSDPEFLEMVYEIWGNILYGGYFKKPDMAIAMLFARLLGINIEHCSIVEMVNKKTFKKYYIICIGVSGWGKSESAEAPHMENGWLVIATKPNGKKIKIRIPDHHEFNLYGDDIAITRVVDGKKLARDFELYHFWRCDHIRSLETLRQMMFLYRRIAAPTIKLPATGLELGHDTLLPHHLQHGQNGKLSQKGQNPRFWVPLGPNEPFDEWGNPTGKGREEVEIDSEFYGYRAPIDDVVGPGILSPWQAALFGLDYPIGDRDSPSTMKEGMLDGEGPWSRGPFVIGEYVADATRTVEGIAESPDDTRILMPSNKLGKYHTGFGMIWAMRSRILEHGLEFAPSDLSPSGCLVHGREFKRLRAGTGSTSDVPVDCLRPSRQFSDDVARNGHRKHLAYYRKVAKWYLQKGGNNLHGWLRGICETMQEATIEDRSMDQLDEMLHPSNFEA